MTYLLTIDIDTGRNNGIEAVQMTTAILQALARGAANIPALEGLNGTASLIPPPESKEDIMLIDFTLQRSHDQTIN